MATAIRIIPGNAPMLYQKGNSLTFVTRIKVGGVVITDIALWDFEYSIICEGCNITFRANLTDFLAVAGVGLLELNVPPEDVPDLPVSTKSCIHTLKAIKPDGKVRYLWASPIDVRANQAEV